MAASAPHQQFPLTRCGKIAPDFDFKFTGKLLSSFFLLGNTLIFNFSLHLISGLKIKEEVVRTLGMHGWDMIL